MVYFGTKNTMAQRAVPSIALYEASLHGYYFLTLDRGKKIHAKKWDQLPINDEIIDQVNSFAEKQRQPSMPRRMPIFEWAPGLIIDVPDDNDIIIDDQVDDSANPVPIIQHNDLNYVSNDEEFDIDTAIPVDD